MFLQKTTVEALLKKQHFLVFAEDDSRGAAEVEFFFVSKEEDGRGAADGILFSCAYRRRQ